VDAAPAVLPRLTGVAVPDDPPLLVGIGVPDVPLLLGVPGLALLAGEDV
jgi:hypothetical protein